MIAIIAMTIDHIACPIMCYFIAEGYHYTKNINKYTRRLFVFSLVSQKDPVHILKSGRGLFSKVLQ